MLRNLTVWANCSREWGGGSLSLLPIDRLTMDRLIEHTQDLPSTLAGFPLWLGFPIDESNPNVLLNVSLLSGTQSAEIYRHKGMSSKADPSMKSIASLLNETGVEGSNLQRISGGRLLLQYSIDRTTQIDGEPMVFLYPNRSTLTGGPTDQGLADLQIACKAMASNMNWNLNGTEWRLAETAYLALQPGTRVGAMGISPSTGRSLQLLMLDFTKSSDVMTFLKRIDWPGNRKAAGSVLERLESHGEFLKMRIGVQFDVSAAGVEPTLVLQIFSADTIYDSTGWFKDKACWTQFIESLHKEGLAVAQKTLGGGLTDSSAEKMLFGRSGLFLLIQRLHHFTIALNDKGAVSQVSAFVFMLMARWPSLGNNANSATKLRQSTD